MHLHASMMGIQGRSWGCRRKFKGGWSGSSSSFRGGGSKGLVWGKGTNITAKPLAAAQKGCSDLRLQNCRHKYKPATVAWIRAMCDRDRTLRFWTAISKFHLPLQDTLPNGIPTLSNPSSHLLPTQRSLCAGSTWPAHRQFTIFGTARLSQLPVSNMRHKHCHKLALWHIRNTASASSAPSGNYGDNLNEYAMTWECCFLLPIQIVRGFWLTMKFLWKGGNQNRIIVHLLL